MSPFFQDPSLYRSVLENLPIGVYVLDQEHRVRFWNRGAEQITGYLAQEVLGQVCRDPLPHFDPRGQALVGDHCPVTTTFRDARAVQNRVFTVHKQGHRLGVLVRTMPLFDENDAIKGIAVAFEETLTNSADEFSGAQMFGCIDPLTGVPSQRLTRAVAIESLAGLQETHKGFGLLRIRILGLKELSGKYGADSMHSILHTAAQTLRHNVDPESFVGRWSETDFLAILPSSSPMKVADTAEALQRLLSSSEITWWGDHILVQAEVECIVARTGDNLESLLSRMQPPHSHGIARAAATGGDSESTTSRG
jgi:two-component system, cell cycle response regulator